MVKQMVLENSDAPTKRSNLKSDTGTTTGKRRKSVIFDISATTEKKNIKLWRETKGQK